MREEKKEKILEELRKKLQAETESCSAVCEWLTNKIGDEAAGHLCDMSDEMKVQACIDHIRIGLASGDITDNQINELLK